MSVMLQGHGPRNFFLNIVYIILIKIKVDKI